jgi:hypothetical protein
MRKLLTLFFFATLLLPFLLGVSHAQEAQENKDGNGSFGFMSSLSVKSSDAKEGDIVILSGRELEISSGPYQNVMVGVVCPKPSYSIKPTSDPLNLGAVSGGTSYNVITSGNVLVNVSGKNGNIKKGDLITSSEVKGTGMKAIKTGYVLGTALEDFTAKEKEEVKKIMVALNVHYASSGGSITTRISDLFKLAALAAYENPKLALKYIATTLMAMFTIFFTFISYGRVARLGIIALGRNPLGSKKIMKGVVINGLISIAIIAGGVAASYVITKII